MQGGHEDARALETAPRLRVYDGPHSNLFVFLLSSLFLVFSFVVVFLTLQERGEERRLYRLFGQRLLVLLLLHDLCNGG